MVVKCILIVRHGAEVTQRSLTRTEALPKSLKGVRELLQSSDMRLEMMTYEYTVASPAVKDSAKQRFRKDADVKEFFSRVSASGAEVTFDVTLTPVATSPKEVASQFMDDDLVTLLIFPPLDAAVTGPVQETPGRPIVVPDVVEKTFIIPLAGTLAGLRRAIADTLRVDNALMDYAPRITVLSITDGSSPPQPIADDAAARSLLRDHAKRGASARLTYTVSAPPSPRRGGSRRDSVAPSPQDLKGVPSSVSGTDGPPPPSSLPVPVRQPSPPQPSPQPAPPQPAPPQPSPQPSPPQPSPPRSPPQPSPQPSPPPPRSPSPPVGAPIRIDVRVVWGASASPSGRATPTVGESARLTFAYHRTDVGLLQRFRATCEEVTGRPVPLPLTIIAGGMESAVASDGELREWTALARESGQPLLVQLPTGGSVDGSASRPLPPLAGAAGLRSQAPRAESVAPTVTPATAPAKAHLPPLRQTAAPSMREPVAPPAGWRKSSRATVAAEGCPCTVSDPPATPLSVSPAVSASSTAARHELPPHHGLRAEALTSPTIERSGVARAVLSSTEAQPHRPSHRSLPSSLATTPRQSVRVLRGTLSESGTPAPAVDGAAAPSVAPTPAAPDGAPAAIAVEQEGPPSVRSTVPPPLACTPAPAACSPVGVGDGECRPDTPRVAVVLPGDGEGEGRGDRGEQGSGQAPLRFQSYVRLVESGSGTEPGVAVALVLCELPAGDDESVIDGLVEEVVAQFALPSVPERTARTLVLREVDVERGLVETIVTSARELRDRVAQLSLSSSIFELRIPARTAPPQTGGEPSSAVPSQPPQCFPTATAALESFAATVYHALRRAGDGAVVGPHVAALLPPSPREGRPTPPLTPTDGCATAPVTVEAFAVHFRECFARDPRDTLCRVSAAVLRRDAAGLGRARGGADTLAAEAGAAVEKELHACMQAALEGVSASAVEAYVQAASASPPHAPAHVLASLVGALLAPLPCPRYANWLAEHFRGRLATVLFARMRVLGAGDGLPTVLPLDVLTSASWEALKLGVAAPTAPSATADSVAASLLRWCLAALQLTCLRCRIAFPPLPPYAGVPAGPLAVVAGTLAISEWSLDVAPLWPSRAAGRAGSRGSAATSAGPLNGRGLAAEQYALRGEKRGSKVHYRFRYQSRPSHKAPSLSAAAISGVPATPASHEREPSLR